MIMKYRIYLLSLIFCLGSLTGQSLFANEVREISWEELLPPGWNPAKVFEDMSDEEFNAMSDDEYRQIQSIIQAEIAKAPVVENLNNQTVRIPGFIVPLEMDKTSIREFLLVPYFGACTHTPPPPANQIIYSQMNIEFQTKDIFKPVWITGKLKTGKFSSQLNETGVTQAADIESSYSIGVDLIEPYEQ